MLSSSQKQEIKEAILNEQKELKLKIAEYKELTKPIAPENAIGRISRMDAINNKSVNEAALRQAEKKLIGIERALEQIGEDHFGLCKGCGMQIPLGRILLVLGTTKCVKCASR